MIHSTLGDYWRALAALRPDAADAQEIAAMLGGVNAAAVLTEAKKLTAATPETTSETTASAPSSKRDPYVPFEVKRVAAEAADTAPEWLSSATPMPVERTRYRAPKLPFEPLLVPTKVRALLSTLLATEVEEGPLDVQRLIASIARREPVTRLFRKRSPTLRRGVQVLVDRGASMSLFARDARWLARELQNVIGAPRVDLWLFADCPARGVGRPEDDEWSTYRAPASGTPVLLLTDLGIGATAATRADAVEWEPFLAAVRAAACPVFVLAPYASHRWPPLAQRIEALPWDRRVTVQLARRSASSARRRSVS